tara:strand:- start:4175 stop:4888 length:714 start_codon:yes stop_codon:yes gene_type:complete
MNNQFTHPKLNLANLDNYNIRRSILNALESNLINFEGEMLDVGCGRMPYKEIILKNSEVINYTGVDIHSALEYVSGVKPDYYWDGQTLPFSANSFECIIATEVLEHCPSPEIILKEILRVLKPGGFFFLTVPFLWSLHEVPHDEYRYTPFSLERHLKSSNFRNINIKATGGWHASMSQMLGLWIMRSPMGKFKRKLLSFFIKPLMKLLNSLDKPNYIQFNEGQMITGLYATAIKAKL